LRREPQAAGAVERLRVGRGARELSVRESGHQARYGKQSGDEPPPAWLSIAFDLRYGKLSWRHVWVAVRSRSRHALHAAE
jgi:hypothetical protein